MFLDLLCKWRNNFTLLLINTQIVCCWSGTCAICLEDFMIHSNANSSLVSSFCGSCFWWYEVLCLVMFFCLAFFESHAPKWVALVPILTHLDHRISYFWIQGSIVNSEYCSSCSNVLFIHSKRMPRKAHFSLFSFSSYDCSDDLP